MNFKRLNSAGKSKIFLICLLSLLLLPANIQAKKYSVVWDPRTIEQVIVFGETTDLSVTFISKINLNKVNLWVVPELQPFVSVEPSHFKTIKANTPYEVTVHFYVPQDAQAGIYKGTIHLKKNYMTYLHALKVELNVIEGQISMTTPYVNSTDIASINEAFSSTACAPWGFAHNGIDFFPNGNLKPFQAVSSGVIEDVQLWQNDISLNWQVNVRIKYNDTYSVEYAFEPFSTIQSDGDTQLANILVSAGQNVSQGDIIGNLYTVGGGAHVHFGLIKDGIAICPEPYFTIDARDSILNLIHIVWPDANMCY